MPDIVHIARCPQHGLHGERDTCFECGRAVDQVPMVELGPDFRFGPNSLIVDRDRAVAMARENQKLWKALGAIEGLSEAAQAASDAMTGAYQSDADIPPALTHDELLSPVLHAAAAALVPAHTIDPVYTVALVAQALVEAALAAASSREEG